MIKRVNNKNLLHNGFSQSGVVILEFSLVLVISAIFLLAIFDLSRYLLIKTVLTSTAQKALSVAQSIDGFDIGQQNFPERYDEFEAARNKIVNVAMSIPQNLLHGLSLAPSSKFLIPFSVYTSVGANDVAVASLDVLVLRPGDSARETLKSKSSAHSKGHGQKKKHIWYDHPQICSPKSPTCKRRLQHLWAKPCHAMSRLLRAVPIVIQLRAEFAFTLPGFGGTILEGKAVGYRDTIPHFRQSIGCYPRYCCPKRPGTCPMEE